LAYLSSFTADRRIRLDGLHTEAALNKFGRFASAEQRSVLPLSVGQSQKQLQWEEEIKSALIKKNKNSEPEDFLQAHDTFSDTAPHL
jgi:hypothetical protein